MLLTNQPKKHDSATLRKNNRRRIPSLMREKRKSEKKRNWSGSIILTLDLDLSVDHLSTFSRSSLSFDRSRLLSIDLLSSLSRLIHLSISSPLEINRSPPPPPFLSLSSSLSSLLLSIPPILFSSLFFYFLFLRK